MCNKTEEQNSTEIDFPTFCIELINAQNNLRRFIEGKLRQYHAFPISADDVQQETNVRAYENRSQLRELNSMSSWLKTIAWRVILEHLRGPRLESIDPDSLAIREDVDAIVRRETCASVATWAGGWLEVLDKVLIAFRENVEVPIADPCESIKAFLRIKWDGVTERQAAAELEITNNVARYRAQGILKDYVTALQSKNLLPGSAKFGDCRKNAAKKNRGLRNVFLDCGIDEEELDAFRNRHWKCP